ncbi:MAG: hypothetical protein C00003105_01387 [ANME-2 cluster archaeon HR1]|jgi:hypothetical protein|nr:MAG: hypothetical protein C00003105_01387 [ANME-2 cluster archaeon HR1]
MNYKYPTKENIIRLHKKIVETTGGEKGMLNEGMQRWWCDNMHEKKKKEEESKEFEKIMDVSIEKNKELLKKLAKV